MWIANGSTTPTLALPRPNETYIHEFLSSSSQNYASHKGKDLDFTEDFLFPSQISEAYPSPDWQYGDGRYYARGFRPTAFQGVLTLVRVPAPSVTTK